LELAIILLTIAFVLSVEALNTAIELLCDRITLHDDPQVAKIKDISAGASLIGVVGAAAVLGDSLASSCGLLCQVAFY
jgi:diacylglycerol kinase (ATP)